MKQNRMDPLVTFIRKVYSHGSSLKDSDKI